MSRKTKERPAQGQPEPPAATTPEAASFLRRLLLALLTALVVSRPFIRGESFGLASGVSDYGGLAWAFLAMLACAAWAGWRALAHRPDVNAGRAELALLGGVGLMFLAATWATLARAGLLANWDWLLPADEAWSSSYARAALLTAWEWLGLLVALFLTRQLAASERERQGLFCVLLATGVALAAQGLYQAVWELPSARLAAEGLEQDAHKFVREQARERLEPVSDAEADLLARRLEGNRPSGPFLYPSTLAGAMALLLPGLVVLAVAAYRHGAYPWQVGLAAFTALLGCAALLLTREWFFVLALLVGSAAAVPRARAALLLVAAVGAAVLYFTGQLSDELTRRADAWPAAWGVIQESSHPWFGVGPAQAPYWMPRYLSETAGAPLGPESALLRLWAEGGLPSVLLFALAGALVVVAGWRWWQTTPPVERNAVQGPNEDLPWEFYTGGMLGVLLSFVIRASMLPPTEVFGAALQAGLGTLAWFGAFAAFEQLACSHAERMTALMAGALSLALALLVGPGWSAPALMGLLFVVVGLLLAQAVPGPVPWLGPGRVSMALPVPALAAGALSFLVLVVVPVALTTLAHKRAAMLGLLYRQEMSNPEAGGKIQYPVLFIKSRLTDPLDAAEKAEKRVVRTYELLADWYAEIWSLLHEEKYRQAHLRAVSAAGLAELNNLESPDGRVIMARVRFAIGEGYFRRARELKIAAGDNWPWPSGTQLALARLHRNWGKEHFEQGATALKGAIRRDPTNPKHYLGLAQLYSRLGDTKKQALAATEAVRLDKKAGRARRLPDPERQLAEKWKQADLKR